MILKWNFYTKKEKKIAEKNTGNNNYFDIYANINL